MRSLLIVALSAIVTLGGCVQPQPRPLVAAPTGEVPPTGATQPTPPVTPGVAAEPGESATAVPPAPPRPDTSSAQSNQPPAGRIAAEPGESPTAAPPAPLKPQTSPARSRLPAVRSPLEAAAASPEESPTAAMPPAPAITPVGPPASLDLVGLEQRLRETNAIGVFTKLSLKNQVDDLLDQFRGFYKGQIKVPLAELRQRYELLLLKVVTLLQDADQQLANAITSSREAIWDVLADPQKFSKI